MASAFDQRILERQKAAEAPTFGDYARSTAASAFDLAGAVPSFVSSVAAQGDDPVARDLEIISSRIAAPLFQLGEGIRSYNTEAAQRILASSVSDPGFYDHPFAWFGLQATNTAAPIVASIAGAIFAGPSVGMMLNMGIAGVHSAGITYNEMVKDLDNTNLDSNPLYLSLIAKGLSPQEARREFKQQAIGLKPVVLGIVTGALARYSAAGQVIGKMGGAAEGAVIHSLPRRVGTAMLESGAEEAAQNTAEEFTSQSARVDTGIQEDYNLPKLGEAAASGALLGAGLGAGAGIPSGRPRAAKPGAVDDTDIFAPDFAPEGPTAPATYAPKWETPTPPTGGATTSRPAPPPRGKKGRAPASPLPTPTTDIDADIATAIDASTGVGTAPTPTTTPPTTPTSSASTTTPSALTPTTTPATPTTSTTTSPASSTTTPTSPATTTTPSTTLPMSKTPLDPEDVQTLVDAGYTDTAIEEMSADNARAEAARVRAEAAAEPIVPDATAAAAAGETAVEPQPGAPAEAATVPAATAAVAATEPEAQLAAQDIAPEAEAEVVADPVAKVKAWILANNNTAYKNIVPGAGVTYGEAVAAREALLNDGTDTSPPTLSKNKRGTVIITPAAAAGAELPAEVKPPRAPTEVDKILDAPVYTPEEIVNRRLATYEREWTEAGRKPEQIATALAALRPELEAEEGIVRPARPPPKKATGEAVQPPTTSVPTTRKRKPVTKPAGGAAATAAPTTGTLSLKPGAKPARGAGRTVRTAAEMPIQLTEEEVAAGARILPDLRPEVKAASDAGKVLTREAKRRAGEILKEEDAAKREQRGERHRAAGVAYVPDTERGHDPGFQEQVARTNDAASRIFGRRADKAPTPFEKTKEFLIKLKARLDNIYNDAQRTQEEAGVTFGERKSKRDSAEASWVLEAIRLRNAIGKDRRPWRFIQEFLNSEEITRGERTSNDGVSQTNPFLEMGRVRNPNRPAEMVTAEGEVIDVDQVQAAGEFAEDEASLEATHRNPDIEEAIRDIKKLFPPATSRNDISMRHYFRDELALRKVVLDLKDVRSNSAIAAAEDLRRIMDGLQKPEDTRTPTPRKNLPEPLTPGTLQEVRKILTEARAKILKSRAAYAKRTAEVSAIAQKRSARGKEVAERVRRRIAERRGEVTAAEPEAPAPTPAPAEEPFARRQREVRERMIERSDRAGEMRRKVREAIERQKQKKAPGDTQEALTFEGEQQRRAEKLLAAQQEDVWERARTGAARPPVTPRSARMARFRADQLNAKVNRTVGSKTADEDVTDTTDEFEGAEIPAVGEATQVEEAAALEAENLRRSKQTDVQDMVDELEGADLESDVIEDEALERARPPAELRTDFNRAEQVQERTNVAREQDGHLVSPYRRPGDPEVIVSPQRSLTVKQLLGELDIEAGLKGLGARFHRSAMTFLRNMLVRAVGNMDVYVLSDFDMESFINKSVDPSRKKLAGAYIEDMSDASQDYVIINERLFQQDPAQVIRTILHEVVHAAVNRGVGKNAKLQTQLKSLMKVVMDHHGIQDPAAHYGFKDIYEFIAEAMTNQIFQQKLLATPLSKEMASQFKAVNAFKAFVEFVRRALRGPHETLSALEALVSVTEEFTTDARAVKRAIPGREARVVKPPAAKSMSEYAEGALDGVKGWVEEIRLPKVDQQTPPWLVKASGFDLLSRAARRYWDSDLNPVRAVNNILEAISEKTRKNSIDAEPIFKALHENEKKVIAAEWNRFAIWQNKATMSGVNPVIPLKDHYWLGVDPEFKPSLKAAQARVAHKELADEFATFSPALQKLSRQVQTFNKARHQAMAKLTIANILAEGMRKKGAKAVGSVDDALVQRIFNRAATEADAKKVGSDLLSRIYKTKEFYAIPGHYVPLMRRGKHIVQAKMKVPKPPAATNGTLKADTDNTYEFRGKDARKNAMAYAANLYGDGYTATVSGKTVDEKTGEMWEVLEDDKEIPGTRKKITMKDPDAERVYQVEVQNDYVEFFDSNAAARRHAAVLEKDPDIITKGVQPRKYSPGDRGVDFLSSDITQLLRSLERRTEFQNMTPEMQHEMVRSIQEFGLQMMGSTRVHKRHAPRRNVRGASIDFTRNMHDYIRSTSSFMARLEHAQELNDALRELDASVDSKSLRKEAAAGRGVLANEVKRRVDLGSGFDTGNKWYSPTLQRLLTTSFISRLASPMYTMMNLLQTPMVAFPVMASRHGPVRTMRMMSQVMRDLGVGKILKKGVTETGKKIVKPYSETETFVDEIKKRLRDKREHQILDNLLQQRGTLELDKLERASKSNAGLAGQVGAAVDTSLSYLESVSRQMPQAAEVVNRALVLITAYRLEMAKNGRNHDAAYIYAQDTNNRTNFNYSEVNAPPMFNSPLGKIAFQFKRFGHGMYSLIGEQIGRAIRNDEPGARAEALKSLAYLAATHVLMAGTLGLPTEPIKGLVVGLFAAGITGFNWQDVEDYQRQLAADLLGEDVGEVLTRGLTRALPLGFGFDMSSRVGLADMFMAREPNTGNPDDFKMWLYDMAAGAPGAMVADWWTGSTDILKGDYGKALPKLLPVKALRDLVKAVDAGTWGKFTPSGRPSFDAYSWSEMFIRAIGATPQREAEDQELKASFYSNRDYQTQRRGDIQQRWADATTAERLAMQGEIERFNRNKPREAWLTNSVLRAYTRRRQTEISKSMAGIVPNKTSRYILERAMRTFNE